MSVNLPSADDAHFFDDEEYVSAPFESVPPSPCELLDPVMRGVMAKELADMVLPGKEKDINEKGEGNE
jgi:hypothetical protein